MKINQLAEKLEKTVIDETTIQWMREIAIEGIGANREAIEEFFKDIDAEVQDIAHKCYPDPDDHELRKNLKADLRKELRKKFFKKLTELSEEVESVGDDA